LAASLLPDVVWRVLPEPVLGALSLPAYSVLCQVLTTLLGLAATRIAFARPAEALGAKRPIGRDLALAMMLAPAVFVVASFIALKIAEPYLVAEMAREGAGASRRNAGAFGKAITEAPLLVTLVWGAVLAAMAEELAFRGALFAAVERSALALLERGERGEAPPMSSAPPISEPATGDRRRVVISGVLAVIVSAAAFGAMHADMKGSVGIVRIASSTCLGVACGSARFWTRTVFVPMTLHFVYNGVSLGLGRGLFRGDSDPVLSVVPNRLLAIAALGVFVSIAVSVARRASRGQA
jgi:membrane protease YdiL (CAAX protease family)